MSFRLSSLIFCRAGIVGIACLAFAGASPAGEAVRNIEVVPLHDGSAMDTNSGPSVLFDSQTVRAWSPQAPHTAQPVQRPGQAMIPPPPPQNNQSSDRERELLDRRRNWVFMSPEDYASDGKKDGGDQNSADKKSTTVLERYFQRLNDSDHLAATNQLNNNKLTGDRFGGQTNLMGGDLRPEGGSFGNNPFGGAVDAGVFQSLRGSDISNPFGSDKNSAMRTPEEVRLESQQKAHMEAYRQIWNIDQPAPAQVSLPGSSAPTVDSGPLFGLSSPGFRSANSVGTPDSGSPALQSATPVPTVTETRSVRPPRADFIPQQRPF